VIHGDAAAEDWLVVNLMETPECRPEDGPAEFSETTGGGMLTWGMGKFEVVSPEHVVLSHDMGHRYLQTSHTRASSAD
jgi:hypothetical protein